MTKKRTARETAGIAITGDVTGVTIAGGTVRVSGGYTLAPSPATDAGLEAALVNLRDAAKALLNFERVRRVRLCASRRQELDAISRLTLERLLDEADQ